MGRKKRGGKGWKRQDRLLIEAVCLDSSEILDSLCFSPSAHEENDYTKLKDIAETKRHEGKRRRREMALLQQDILSPTLHILSNPLNKKLGR